MRFLNSFMLSKIIAQLTRKQNYKYSRDTPVHKTSALLNAAFLLVERFLRIQQHTEPGRVRLWTMERGGRVSWRKYGPLVSVFVVFLAFWFRSPQRTILDDRLDTVLSSLLRAERKVGMNDVARPKVAIGECKCWANSIKPGKRDLSRKKCTITVHRCKPCLTIWIFVQKRQE